MPQSKITGAQIEKQGEQIYAKVNRELKILIDSDPQLNREDSCKGALHILSQIKSILQKTNSLPVQERAKYYYLAYNAVSYIEDISGLMRNSNFSFEAIKILLDCIGAMQGNLILQDVKYLDKRVKLYLDVCHIYEEGQFFGSAIALLQNGIQKIKDLKSLHEQDPPVPTYVSNILMNNLNILKIMSIKYSVQGGTLSANDWKKKVDQQFGTETKTKLTCLVECLRTQTRRKSNIFQKGAYSSGKNFKEGLLQAGYDFVKGSMDTLTKALNQQKTKISKEVQFRTSMQQKTQENINEQIKRKRQSQQGNTKEKDYKKASLEFPLEFHTQMIHYCMETKNSKFLSELIESALVRVECHRIQVPYLNDVAIIVSNSQSPNIPNGYQKIPVDLNEANYWNQLKKLRSAGKKKQQVKQKEVKKDDKKGGKQPPPPQNKKDKSNDAATQQQLQQIKHKYVYMILKKSMSPQNAIYNIKIVLGDQETGPSGFPDTRKIIIPYIQENMKSLSSSVNQYPGVRESTHQVPYIVLYHSKNSLQNEQQKRTLVTDIKPLIGKNPMIPAEWGYNKIAFDLRQVPAEFIKHSGHDYVYLTYKSDEMFNVNSRHIQILNALNELEKSYPKEKVGTIEQQKMLEMQVNYDVDKLQRLFSALQISLDGVLGQDYYQAKNDFLTHLVFHIWTKYLRGPLVQFDYILEQRLHQQIIDYDYNYYKDLIDRCKRIFLQGFRVFNLILQNNKKADILLFSRINLQLVKYLEEVREYRTGAESAKLCLQRIWEYRDQYLSKGVDNSQDKLLPFSISCSNLVVKDTISRMKQNYRKQRRQINKILRIKKREKNGQKQLTEEQLDQQQNQYIKFEKHDDVDETIQKIGTQHSQLFSLVSAIQIDITNIYFRVALKHADELKKRAQQTAGLVTNGIKNSQLEGLSSTLVQKLNLMTKPNQLTNQKNLKDLQSTLVNANQIPPPNPILHRSEKKLLEDYSKNPYLLSLLLMNLGAINSANEQKRYFLQKSLQAIQKAQENQKSMSEDAVNNAIFVFSTLWDHELNEDQNSVKVSPFKQLYDGTWPSQSQVPSVPILVSRNAHSVSMKLPPYKPMKVPKKKTSQIKFMSLYGKISANRVDVSTNCNQLEGTGLKKKMGKVVKVTNLNPNNMYCFAVAGTNQNQELQSIGKTSTDIGTCHPLPVAMLASYLAKVSYQINEFQIAEKAAKIVLTQICQKPDFLTQDQRLNRLYMYRFNEKALGSIPLPEIRSIAQAFYVLALCERKKLQMMTELTPILRQQKEKEITNLVMLSGFLTPSLSCPLSSLPFLIPDREIITKALMISLIPSKWMNPKVRKLGVRVMSKVLKWGLQKNEVNLARRITYRWIQRKWLMLGKIIQVEQKKEVKKGAKDTKEQQVKMIDKYCRFIVEKTPGLVDDFQQSMLSINDEYSDYVAMFVEKAKQQIANLTQYTDNTPQQIDSVLSIYNAKIEFLQSLKNPLASVGKIPVTSPLYLEYNSKILKRAMQLSPESEYKSLIAKSEQINVTNKTPEVQLSQAIYGLMVDALKADIQWSPQSKNQLIILQQNTGKDLSKAISIFNSYEEKMQSLSQKVCKMHSFLNKFADYDYLNTWISELYYLKALALILNSAGTFTVAYQVPGRYDKIKSINLQDLLKKSEEMAIIDKQKYSYSQQRKTRLNKIFEYLAKSAYSAYCVQNWIKLSNVIKTAVNIIGHELSTPFYHLNSGLQVHFSLLCILSIFMLRSIREKGFDTFKIRYEKKKAFIETDAITKQLQLEKEDDEPLVDPFYAVYYLPQLDKGTTKQFWFTKYSSKIDIQSIGSLVAYTVQSLRVQNKYNLVINIVRDFCNVTQHFFSLQLLPFMIQSQEKLMQSINQNINIEKKSMSEVYAQYEKQKNSKKRGARQAQITGEKPKYEIEYEQKSKKIKESLSLLEGQKDFILKQCRTSKTIIQQIKRDTSNAVIEQKQRRKDMLQYAHDQNQMVKQYGDQSKLVKNRKNIVKDIINKYNEIYKQLKNNKTSKDTLAQIQNRHDVGNLYFTAANLDKAQQHWTDALSTIFKTVDPINNISSILEQKQPFMVNILGLKQSLLSISLMYKITKFGAFKEIRKQKKSTELVCKVVKAVFQVDGKHPQNFINFGLYRLKQLAEKEPFQDQTTLNLAQLCSALQFFALRAIDQKWALQSLPISTLLDYISTDIVKNSQLSIKAKIIKAIALAEAGLISEAIILLTKVANQKDLPIIWLESTQVVKKQRGQYWYTDGPNYSNAKSWNEAQNKEPIQNFKKINIKPEFGKLYGIFNPTLFKYAKSLIQFKAYQTQICDNFDMNQTRLDNLTQAQNSMRDCLKRLSFIQQFYQLLEDHQNNQLAFKQNQVSEQLKTKTASSKAKVQQYLKSNGNDEQMIKTYLKQESGAIKRSQILQTICRIRFTISKLNQSRNQLSNCFFILKNALTNINRYSSGVRNVELGTEPQIKPKVAAQNPTGKKEEKKGGKKEEQPKVEKAPEIDTAKQQEIRIATQAKKARTTVSVYWHLKIAFEIGKVMYKQNRFKTAVKIFQDLCNQCIKYQQQYFFFFAKGYVCRSMLRLGKFSTNDFEAVIHEVQQRRFFDEQYICLVMDFGQLNEGTKRIEMFSKGRSAAQNLWIDNYKVGVLAGIGAENSVRAFTGKSLLTAEQSQEIQRKKKGGDQKGGKDDKKGAKKQDPKKKKEQSKMEFKVQPICKYQWFNLLDDQKSALSNYTFQPHPNYHSNNIHNQVALLYIKAHIRYVRAKLLQEAQLDLLEQIRFLLKILHIAETYSFSSYYFKVNIYYLLADMNKRVFIEKMGIIAPKTKKILQILSIPYEDYPLNSQLIKIPSYMKFLTDNLPYLKQSVSWFQKIASSVKNNNLFLENSFPMHQVFWELADTHSLLAEYTGRQVPKYCPPDMAPQNPNFQLERMNSIFSCYCYIDMSNKISTAYDQLMRNYTEIGTKAFQANVKLDQDLVNQILEMDQQYKTLYPQFLADFTKPKVSINILDLVTYMIKIYRESQLMTFSNSHLQNILLKCHRILGANVQTYKQRCILSNTEVILKTDLSQAIIQPNFIAFKSKRISEGQRFLYVLAPVDGQLNQNNKVLYGRVNYKSHILSVISEQLFSLRAKLSISSQKSESVKNRDFIWQKRDFLQIINKIALGFNPEIEKLDQQTIPELNYDNTTILLNMLGSRGAMAKSNQINKMLRKFHQMKYKTGKKE